MTDPWFNSVTPGSGQPDQIPSNIGEHPTTARGLSPNTYDEEMEQGVVIADSDHNAMIQLLKQNAALIARLERLEKPDNSDESAPPGGAPVAHHLHLVDGRVVINHGGVGTHYSETLPDGSQRVTRVKEYFRADEPDPSTLFV